MYRATRTGAVDFGDMAGASVARDFRNKSISET